MNEWRVRQLHETDHLRAQVVESIQHQTHTFPGGAHAYVIVSPEAVIVSTHGDQQAFDMQGKPVGMGELANRIGGIWPNDPG